MTRPSPSAVLAAALLCLLTGAAPALAAPGTGSADGFAQQTRPGTAPVSGTALEKAAPPADAPLVKAGAQNGRIAAETDRFIVTFREVPAPAQESMLAEAAESTPLESPEVIRERADATTIVETAEPLGRQEQSEVIVELEADPRVSSVEPDLVIVSGAAAYPTSPKDPHFGSRQWNLRYISAPGAWQQSTGAGVTIGVGDTGTTSHPDLNSKWVSSYDFLSDAWHSKDGGGRDANAHDQGDDVLGNGVHAWHGTHVSGIAAASTNNGVGVAGVAPDAKIAMARNMGRDGRGYVSDYADSLMWLAGITIPGAPRNRTPAQVVNFSEAFDAPTCPSVLRTAISRSSGRNVPVVVSAGNAAKSANGVAPANCPGALVVGATTSAQTMARFSNWGPMVDVVAPGQDIYSTTNSGVRSLGRPSYGYLSGTSMAAPHVAGVVALMKEKNPTLTTEQIRTTLRSTGSNLGGYRFVDARRALSATPDRRGSIGRYYLSKDGARTIGVAVAPQRAAGHSRGMMREYYRPETGHTIYIFSSPTTGVRHVDAQSTIGAWYMAHGGHARYGFPTRNATSRTGGSFQDFVHPDKGTTTRITSTGGRISVSSRPLTT